MGALVPSLWDCTDAEWLTLVHRDYTDTSLATVDLGSTAGAVSIPSRENPSGDAAVLVNASGNFLKATSGLVLDQGRGLRLDTASCTTGPNGNVFGAVGSGVYWSLTTLLSATLWPNTQPGPERIWSQLFLVAWLDTSAVNANGEGCGIVFANNTTFGLGTSAGVVRTAGAMNALQDLEGSGFTSTGSAAVATLGMPSTPDVAGIFTGAAGGQSVWGVSPGGVVLPSRWFSRDQHMDCAALNGPNTTGGYVRNTGVVGFVVYDTAKTSVQVWLKRWILFGRNPARRFPTGDYTQLTVVA